MKPFFSLLLALCTTALLAQNQPPLLSNLRAEVNWITQTLTLQYDVSDAENDPLDISLSLSDNGGNTYTLSHLLPATGHVGYPVQPGTGRLITCDVGQLPGLAQVFTVRLVADDRQPFSLQTLVNEVDSNRLLQDMRFVEGIRHRTAGPLHLAAVRDSMMSRFQHAALHVQQNTFNYTGGYTGRNVIGTLPGTTQARQVVIADAHYDSMNNSPGADDNGSGVVGVLELARLLSRYPVQKTLRFIGFDLEEAGLVGSKQYVTNGIPAGDTMAGVFNFEMIGYYSEQPNSQKLPTGFEVLFPAAYNAVANDGFRGNFITNVGNTTSKPLITRFANAAAQYVPDLRVISVEAPGNSQIAPDLRRSDHAPFWDSGHPALMLTDGANFRNLCYHTGCDTTEDKLNFTFMSRVVKATLAAMAELAGIQHGDWATATFQGTVSTSAAAARPCMFSLRGNAGTPNALYLSAPQCPLTQVGLKLYDQRGTLLFQKDLAAPLPEEPTPLFLPFSLPAGLYLAQFTWPDGSWTERVVVR